jgi:DnaK suppressor protein
MNMTDTTHKLESERYRDILLIKQATLAGSLRHRDEIVIEKASDSLDEVQQMGERELAIRNLDRDSSMLRQIRHALARIADGSFGVCRHCEDDISPKRLAAVPWAAYCIKCQERLDRREIEAEEHTDFAEIAA